MAAVRKTVSVHEKTVQKVAENAVIVLPRKRGKARRPRNSRVEVKHWYDGVDPMLVDWVRTNKIYYKCVEVISPTEIIVHEEY